MSVREKDFSTGDYSRSLNNLSLNTAALRIADHRLLSTSARFKLSTHLLDLRCLFFHHCCECLNLLLLRLVSSVLFEKLVEQHRINRFVSHGVGLAFVIPRDKVRINFGAILGDKSKLWDAFGIQVLLVTELHRLER